MPNIIQKNPNVLGGMAVIRGTRIPVSRILALVGMDYKLTDIRREFPQLKKLNEVDFVDITNFALLSSRTRFGISQLV